MKFDDKTYSKLVLQKDALRQVFNSENNPCHEIVNSAVNVIINKSENLNPESVELVLNRAADACRDEAGIERKAFDVFANTVRSCM